MDKLIFVINLMVAVAGLYMAFESVKMKKSHKIVAHIYLSTDLQMRKCKNEAEYCEYVAPKGAITGVLVSVLSALAAFGYFFDQLMFFTNWSFVGVLALYGWFLSYAGKANRTYF